GARRAVGPAGARAADRSRGRGEPGFVEPRRRLLRERLGAQVGERRAAPELEVLAELLRRVRRAVALEQLASLVDEALERVEVELVALADLELISARPREHP